MARTGARAAPQPNTPFELTCASVAEDSAGTARRTDGLRAHPRPPSPQACQRRVIVEDTGDFELMSVPVGKASSTWRAMS